MMKEVQRVVAQEDDKAPVDPSRQVEQIGEERRHAVLMVDSWHQNVLNDVE